MAGTRILSCVRHELSDGEYTLPNGGSYAQTIRVIAGAEGVRIAQVSAGAVSFELDLDPGTTEDVVLDPNSTFTCGALPGGPAAGSVHVAVVDLVL